MKQDALARWIKFVITGVGICGFVVYSLIMPRFGAYLVKQNTMLERNVLPWLILMGECYPLLWCAYPWLEDLRQYKEG